MHNTILVKDDGTLGEPINAQYIREYIRVLLGYNLFDWVGTQVDEDSMILNYDFKKVEVEWVNKLLKTPTNVARTIVCLTSNPQHIDTGITYTDEQGMRVIYVPHSNKKKDIDKVRLDILSKVIY